MSNPAIRCDSIAVSFGELTALDSVTVEFEAGKIHALVGQNGAGKTTLARVIAGLVTARSGTVTIDGRVIHSGDVIAARKSGVEMVHQSFTLPPSMTVAESLEFGSTEREGRLFSRSGLNRRWQKHLDELGVPVNASQRLRSLPVETLQSIEIARALSGDARILILDEPTAVLPPESVERLFEQIRTLRDAGVTIIIVLHKVKEVLRIAETVTVLRKGKLVLAGARADRLAAADLAEAIIGPDSRTIVEDGEPVLSREDGAATSLGESPGKTRDLVRLRSVSSADGEGGPGLKSVDFAMAGHQIVGVAGVEGNGQVALARVIAGLSEARQGSLELMFTPANRLTALARRKLGLRIIPFERNTEGVSGTSPLWQNWSIPLITGGRGWGLRPVQLRKLAEESLRAWDVAFTSVNQNASELSGGNVQKVILARELDEGARVIIAAQPTRGLDLGAVRFVWDALRRARGSGAAVLLISSDLDELVDICDRIIVVLGGRIVLDVLRPFELSAIGRAMTGAES